MTPNEYAALLKKVEKMKSRLFELSGERAALLSDLKTQYKCKTAAGGQKKLTALRKSRKALEAELSGEADAWEKEFGENF